MCQIESLLLLLQAALPHMKEGASIINTSSVTAYKGSPGLIDYSSTKGAQVRRAESCCNN
jgi:NAD(P)-dependent dehydrogenase (short-subunit alcohol dehydrogenase family)